MFACTLNDWAAAASVSTRLIYCIASVLAPEQIPAKSESEFHSSEQKQHVPDKVCLETTTSGAASLLAANEPTLVAYPFRDAGHVAIGCAWAQRQGLACLNQASLWARLMYAFGLFEWPRSSITRSASRLHIVSAHNAQSIANTIRGARQQRRLTSDFLMEARRLLLLLLLRSCCHGKLSRASPGWLVLFNLLDLSLARAGAAASARPHAPQVVFSGIPQRLPTPSA